MQNFSPAKVGKERTLKKKILFKELLTKHPADIAEILSHLSDEQAAELLRKLAVRKAAAAPLGEMEPEESAEILDELSHDEAIGILGRMDPDDAVDLLAALPVDAQRSFLAQMDAKEAKVLIDLLAYSPDTAGGLMSPEVVALPLDMTAAEAIDELRRRSEEVETVYYAYVVDDDHSLKGVLALRDLALSPPTTRLAELLLKDVTTISVDTDVEEVGLIFDKYNYIALPVVDDTGKLLGIITVDDVIDVIRKEATEDFLKFSGIVGGDEEPLSPPAVAVRKRLPWMAANIIFNLLAVTIIAGFENTLAQVVILAAFLPMITDMGGNIGIQAIGVAIRGLALGKVSFQDLWRVLRKEVAVGLLNGLLLGLQIGVIAYFWKGNIYLGVIITVAMWINVLLAGIIGTAIPFIFNRLGKDPAMMSGAFLTTITDATGLFIFLGLATLVMHRLV